MSVILLNLIFLRILQVLAVCCTIVAIFLIMFPKGWVQNINAFFNKWIPTKKFLEKFDKVTDLEDQYIKIRRILGFIALVLAVILFYLSSKY